MTVLVLTLALFSIGLGCVSADDTNSTMVSIDENSQLENINEITIDENNDTLKASENDGELSAAGDYVQIKDHATGKTGTVTTSDSTVSVDMTWSGAGGTTLYLYVDGVETSNSYSVSLFENYGSADSAFTYSFSKEGTYNVKIDTGSHIYESNTITYIYQKGSGTDPIPGGDVNASISIYDMAYPSQTVINSNGDYVSDIAYNIVKSGDGFSDESLEVFVNGVSVGVTTPNVSNRLGNITFDEDNEWRLYVVYSAQVNGKTVNATSNVLTFITRNTSGGNASSNSSESDDYASVSIYDIDYPSQSVINSSGKYVGDIAYNIVKSGDGFSDESLEVFVNGVSVGVTTPNISNRLGNITFDENDEWKLYVVYSAQVNGKTVNATSNVLTFITRNNEGSSNESGSEMQVIIRDSNNPANSVIDVNDVYHLLLEYYVIVPASDFLLTNDLIILCNGEALFTVNPADKAYTDVGRTILINETGDYVFSAKYMYYGFDIGSGEVLSNSIIYHASLANGTGPEPVVGAVSISIDNVTFPNPVTAVVQSNVDGDYLISVGSNSYDVTVLNGNGNVSFSLPVGNYIANIVSKNDSSIFNLTAFAVNPLVKENITIESNFSLIGNDVFISIRLPSDISSENVTVTLNGKVIKEVVVFNGNANLEFNDLTAGDYSYNVVYAGNEKYNGNNVVKTFTIEEDIAAPFVSITIEDVTYPSESIAFVKSNVDGDYIISVDGNSYDVTVLNGNGNVSFALPAGNYTADIFSKTNHSIANHAQFKVNPLMITSDFIVKESRIIISISMSNDIDEVTVRLNDGSVNSTSVFNRKATVEFSNLKDGNYTYAVEYNGIYDVKSFTITTSNQNSNGTGGNNQSSYAGSTIIASNLIRGFNSGYDFKATFYDKNGNLLKHSEVNFIINGNDNFVKTDEYGVARIAHLLSVGKYEVEICNQATGESLVKKVTIKDRITGNKDISMDYTYSVNYKIRVFSDIGQAVGAGEKVVITLNKVKHNVLTDKNGYAVLKISGLTPKTYAVTAEYKGVKVSNKVVVKQILKAKNAKFKKSIKVKKFTATLKTSKGKAISGKKITLKVKGKTYKAKTNKKGVATFKIKNLNKPGKFKATVSYLKTSIKKTITVGR